MPDKNTIRAFYSENSTDTFFMRYTCVVVYRQTKNYNNESQRRSALKGISNLLCVFIVIAR